MTTPNDVDPFAGGDKVPALSFKGATIGTSHTLTVTEPAALVQTRDFDTDEPATWPDGNPKMAAVVKCLDAQGEPVAVWATKPSSMFSAIAAAQTEVRPGYRLKSGDTLWVQFYDEEPAKSAKHSPRKLYRAKVKEAPPADAFGDADPWGTAPAATPAQSAPAASSTPAATIPDEPPF